MANRFWVGGAGTWDASSTTHWSATSGGAGGASVPTSADAVIIDASSGSGTITLASSFNANGASLSVNNAAISLSPGTASSLICAGSIALTACGGMSVSISLTGSGTITNAAGVDISLSVSSATATLSGAQHFSTLVNNGTGTITAGSANVSISGAGTGGFQQNNALATVNMGSGTWTLSGGNWDVSAGTVNAGTSTLKFTGSANQTFAGGGYTYNNVIQQNSATARLDVTGSNTLASFAPDTSSSSSGMTTRFTAGTTTTLSALTATTSSSKKWTVTSPTAAQHTLSMASGLVSIDYADLSYSNATGGATWYAGANSTDSGNNAGWVFSAPGAGDSLFFGNPF